MCPLPCGAKQLRRQDRSKCRACVSVCVRAYVHTTFPPPSTPPPRYSVFLSLYRKSMRRSGGAALSHRGLRARPRRRGRGRAGAGSALPAGPAAVRPSRVSRPAAPRPQRGARRHDGQVRRARGSRAGVGFVPAFTALGEGPAVPCREQLLLALGNAAEGEVAGEGFAAVRLGRSGARSGRECERRGAPLCLSPARAQGGGQSWAERGGSSRRCGLCWSSSRRCGL